MYVKFGQDAILSFLTSFQIFQDLDPILNYLHENMHDCPILCSHIFIVHSDQAFTE